MILFSIYLHMKAVKKGNQFQQEIVLKGAVQYWRNRHEDSKLEMVH